ncbi:uncharacterized protein METZ01_LOCUS232736, partial [marine metagenome]
KVSIRNLYHRLAHRHPGSPCRPL